MFYGLIWGKRKDRSNLAGKGREIMAKCLLQVIVFTFYNIRKACNRNGRFTWSYQWRQIHINIKRRFDSNKHEKTCCQAFSLLWSRLKVKGKVWFNKIYYFVKQRHFVWGGISKGLRFPNTVSDCWRKKMKLIVFLWWRDNLFEKFNQLEQTPLIRQHSVWVKCSRGKNLSWISREYFFVKFRSNS